MSELRYPPPYQDLATLAQHICAGESTIENWIAMGHFPGPKKKIGGKRLWSWAEVSKFIEGQQDSGTTDLLGRITNATRRESSHNDRGIRERHQGISGISKVSESRLGNATELPPLSDPRRIP